MECVAERLLVWQLGDEKAEVHVRIGQPVLHETGLNWMCPYQISCDRYSRSRAAHGEDTMQALQLALAILDVELGVLLEKLGGGLYEYDKPFVSILENGRLQIAEAVTPPR
jgi:hypothetical protein